MTLITKPDFTYVWASGGAVVAPNDSKKQLGWVAEAPPFQYDNWLQNRQDQMLAHINQRGIAAWDALTNYEAGGLSYVQGSDGKVYKSVAASGPSATVQNPTTDGTDTYWTVAFADAGAFLNLTGGVLTGPLYGTEYHASNIIDRLEGGNPTIANQAIGSSSSGSLGEHCFGARAYNNVTGYSCYFGRVDGVNPAFASWYYIGSAVGTITTNGSSTSYNTTSDYRLKADVTDLGYSLERIQGLKPKAYRWLATDKWGAGFLAHELAVVMPDAVTGEKDAVKSILDEAGEVIGEEVVPQVVDYSKIVVYLVGAIQEQQAQIDSLVSRIAKLEDTTA